MYYFAGLDVSVKVWISHRVRTTRKPRYGPLPGQLHGDEDQLRHWRDITHRCYVCYRASQTSGSIKQQLTFVGNGTKPKIDIV
jgi:hypothetical protein